TCQLVVGQGEHQPLKDMSGGFQTASVIAQSPGPAEPIRTKTSVGILERESIVVVRIHILSRAEPLAGDFPPFELAPVQRVAEAHQTMRSAACRSDDRLSQLFLDQPRYIPGFSRVVLPGGVGVQVMGE